MMILNTRQTVQALVIVSYGDGGRRFGRRGNRLAGPDRGTGTGLYAMVAKVGIVIQSDLEPMSVTPRRYF
jgi:hypothetical protein